MALALQHAQVAEVVRALLAHVSSSKGGAAKPSLLEEGEPISLIIGLKRIPDQSRVKPYRMSAHFKARPQTLQRDSPHVAV